MPSGKGFEQTREQRECWVPGTERGRRSEFIERNTQK